jgi:hypothetical protein
MDCCILSLLSLQLLERFNDWTTPIKNFKVAARIPTETSLVSSMSSLTVTQPSDICLPTDADADAKAFYTQLIGLSRAVGHLDAVHSNAVYANLEYAAFAVSWYSHPSWGDLQDTSSISSLMESYGIKPSTADFHERFGPNHGKEFFANVKLVRVPDCRFNFPTHLIHPKKLGEAEHWP